MDMLAEVQEWRVRFQNAPIVFNQNGDKSADVKYIRGIIIAFIRFVYYAQMFVFA